MLCHLTSEVHKCVAVVSLYYGTDSSASCRAAPTLESTVLVKHWELNCSGCMRNMFVPHNCIYSKKKCSRNVTNSRLYDTKCVENQGCSILCLYEQCSTSFTECFGFFLLIVHRFNVLEFDTGWLRPKRR